MDKLGIAVIGGGSIASVHVQVLAASELGQVVGIADSDPAARERWKKSGLRTEADYKALLAEDSVQVVDICLPHHLHEIAAEEALAWGKHVILEMPIARSGMEADAMLAAARLANRRLIVSHNQLFQPTHQELKRRLEAGEIGRPFLGVVTIIGNEFARMNDPQHWKGDRSLAGGGVMIDTGMHALYLLEYLLGPVRAVTAVGKRLLVAPHNKGEDNAVVALEFDESLGSIIVTYTASGHPWYERREVHGPKGSLYSIDEGPESMLILVQGAERQELLRLPSTWAQSIADSLEDALRAIRTGEQPLVSDELVRHAMATMDAIYRSMEAGQRVAVEA